MLITSEGHAACKVHGVCMLGSCSMHVTVMKNACHEPQEIHVTCMHVEVMS